MEMMKAPKGMLLALVMCVSVWASNHAFAFETWHPRLSDLANESDLIAVGHISKVSKRKRLQGFEQKSDVKVTVVLKGKKDLSSLQLLDWDDPNQVCPPIVGVQPQRSYIMFLTPVDQKTDTCKPTERRGTKLLPEDPKTHERLVAVLRRHLAYLEGAEKTANDLKEIVLDELESETLFDVGFSTLFYAQYDNLELLNAMNEEDQVRIFEAFRDKPFWYMDWANLAGILFRIDRRSPRLLNRIAQKLRREQDADGPFGRRIAGEYKYFYAMCLIDASIKDDLGTGIPQTGDPFNHVRKREDYSDAQRNGIIKVFFERLGAAVPGWQEEPQGR